MKHVSFYVLVFLMCFSQPLWADSLDVVVVWHQDSPVSYYLNQLKARQIEMSLPSQARLIRLPLPTSRTRIQVNIYGKSYYYGDADEALSQVGVIKNGTEGVSDDNYTIYIPENAAPIDVPFAPPLPLHTPRCGNNRYLNMSQNQGFSCSIAILDTGTDTLNSVISSRLDKQNSYNCMDNDGNIQSPRGTHHGPFVASIVSRFMSNADNLLIFKVLDSEGKGTLFDAIKGIDKAILAGVNGIVMSFVAKRPNVSTSTFLTPLGVAIEIAKNNNIITFSAAGNDNNNIAAHYYVPAAEPFANNIAVGSSDCNYQKSTFSNFSNAASSDSQVGLSAIGENVIGYGSSAATILKWNGTSFSNPMIAGVAVQLWHNRAANLASYADIVNALLQNTTYEPSWDATFNSNTGSISKGNVHAQNTYNALIMNILPIVDLKLKMETTDKGVALKWQSSHDKKITNILIEKSKNGVNFVKSGSVQGNQMEFTDTNPFKGVSYYRVIRFDENNQTDTGKIASITINQNLDMQIFPNPASLKDKFTIRYTLEDFLENGRIIISDMYQKTHFVFPLQHQPADTYELELFNERRLSFPSGMYEIIFQVGAQTERRKFVILQ